MQADDTDAGRSEIPRRPAYRNLRIWIESFELTLDVFQLALTLDGQDARALGRRLIDCSCRVPVAVARGQAAGSATQFIGCLHQALSDLSEAETHLLMLEQLGHVPTERARDFEIRLLGIRRMAGSLIRRLEAAKRGGGESQGPGAPVSGHPTPDPPSPSGQTEPPRSVTTWIRPDGSIRVPRRTESGSALLMALLVSAALGILGFTFLQIAGAESTVSARARDRDQVLHAAEAGARAVKAWFDAPAWGDPASSLTARRLFLGRFDPRHPGPFDRGRRLLDHDGDPSTARRLADGSPGLVWYRQGRELVAGLPHLDLFQKPYRADLSTMLLGVEEGPDLILEDSPGAVDLLDELNAALFSRQERTGRIERIELWGPEASAGRLGIATIKVTAAKYARLDRDGAVPVVPPGARPLARAVVRAGLAEIPVGLPRGPLESCGRLTSLGRLRAAWGRVMAAGDVELPPEMAQLDAAVASAVPYASYGRRIGGLSPGDSLADWLDDADASIEDPWLKVVAGGELTGWADLPDQPFPYDPSRPIDVDHSNLFQRVAGIECARPAYGLWKRIAVGGLPGDRDAYYFAYDPASGLFRENGSGEPRSVRDATHGRSGLFFFDTLDGFPPHTGNLTPPVSIVGGPWSTAGVIFLNAESFLVSDVEGSPRVMFPPGEPFDDPDHDLVHGAAEMYVNLRYATAAGTGTAADEMLKEATATQSVSVAGPGGEPFGGVTTLGRDRRGVPMLQSVSLYGWLFNSGDIVAEGKVTHFGSLLAGRDVIQPTPGADTPAIYFDERLNTGEWPPPDLAMPRTYVTFWQTSRP